MSDNYCEDMNQEDHYLNQFKNRSKGRINSPKNRLGNATSCSHSRPSGSVKCSQRINEKMINNDTQLYQTVDHHQSKTQFLYRKSSIQTIVSHDKTNRKNQQKPTVHNVIKQMKVPKMIHLEKIACNLYLGNLESALDFHLLAKKKIHVVINVSDCVISNRTIDVHNICYKDTRSLGYHQFLHILTQSLQIIDMNHNKNILIACTKGVNRSVSIVVGYAITRKGNTYEEISEYIEDLKKDICGNWDNLTNNRIRNLLKTLSNLRATLLLT